MRRVIWIGACLAVALVVVLVVWGANAGRWEPFRNCRVLINDGKQQRQIEIWTWTPSVRMPMENTVRYYLRDGKRSVLLVEIREKGGPGSVYLSPDRGRVLFSHASAGGPQGGVILDLKTDTYAPSRLSELRLINDWTEYRWGSDRTIVIYTGEGSSAQNVGPGFDIGTGAR